MFAVEQQTKNRQSRLGERSGGDQRNGRVTEGAAGLGIFRDHVAERLLDQIDSLCTGLQLAVAPLLDDPVRIDVIATSPEFTSKIFVGPATLLHGLEQPRSTEFAHRAIYL